MTFDLRPCKIPDVANLFEQYHGYGSVGRLAVACFAVFEDSRPIAAYVWQPPRPGPADVLAPSAPWGVLALSRMVAVPKAERRLKHISKPLRQIMRSGLDRTRWPILVTYSDGGQGHTGYVYKCSGWTEDGTFPRKFYTDAHGARRSIYANGAPSTGLTFGGTTLLTRWVHRLVPIGEELAYLNSHGWFNVPDPRGRTWRSGNLRNIIVHRPEGSE